MMRQRNKQDAIITGLKNLRANKRKLVLIEEPIDAEPITECPSSPIIKPKTAYEKMFGTADMPESIDVTMTKKAFEPKPPLKRRRLKEMTLKKKKSEKAPVPAK